MAVSFDELISRLKVAQAPEDAFDGVVSAEDLRARFREWAALLHPDKHRATATAARADEGFKLLNTWHKKALAKMKDGHYGDRSWIEPVTLKTKKEDYIITRRVAEGDVTNAYQAGKYALKICRNPANNDLLINEAEILRYLWEEAATKDLKAMTHIVKYHDSFELASAGARKQVNICQFAEGYYTLAQVRSAYANGIDMRDSAWMFNRVLGALVVTQQAGVVHNAILPEHVLIHPAEHNARLCGWSAATRGKAPVKVMVGRRLEFYPPEVAARRPTTPATDLYMLAKTILFVTNPATLPRNLAGFLRACLLAQRLRPQDPWAVFQEFFEELKAAFGERKFRRFAMT
jgi:hypothetical protein